MDQSKLSLGQIVEAYVMIFSGFSLAYIFDLNRQNKEIIDLDYFINDFL
jgi:hypothetical protein